MNLLSDLDHPFAGPPPELELVGGPLDAGLLAIPSPVLPHLVGVAGRCGRCGRMHPVGGTYRRVGTPAPGYPGQFLWVPGDPLD